MRMISYRTGAQEPWQAGIEQDGRVVAASTVHNFGNQAPTVRALLEAGPTSVEAALASARKVFQAGGQAVLSLDAVEVGPPVPDPDKIICLGLNYADHAAESNMAIPEAPVLFAKFRNSLVGPRDAIVLPRVSNQIDYEAELAVIIGRTCKDVAESEALSYVAGYSIMNDVSARDLQMRTSQWTAGKALDTFAPMGPGITPASEIPDPQNLMVTARVNGQVLQHASTKLMIFSVARTIAFISSIMTLVPGDIIATGTPAGVGFTRKPPIFLHDGDVVEIEIEKIGTIVNRVVGPR
ncbi:MAG TPA: fumarylacetoacetate hydrolase family protein [Ktedonobacteraceae bacterium]|nr:fumarylacetoacetate hydrolase family protein [Ktedonobacteraceae bacterium]